MLRLYTAKSILPVQRCFRQTCRLKALKEETPDWFQRSATWIKRSPLILGGSGFVFVLLNRLSYGGSVGLDFGTAASRADVLCLVTSSILVLTGLNWISIKEREVTTLELKGEEKEEKSKDLEKRIMNELRWSWSALSEATRMDCIMIFYKEQGVFYKGIGAYNMSQITDLVPGKIVKQSISEDKAIYIPKLNIYPGSIEFFEYLPNGSQSVIIQPFPDEGALIISSATERAFSKLDQAWISVISQKISSSFS